jgi:F-type H+-transporting ATPase subunit delta
MTARTASRRYAAALFDVATRSGDVDDAERDLNAFRDLVAGHAELKKVLETPAVPTEKKRAIVQALLARTGDGPANVRRLIAMLADRDRLALVADVAAAFSARVRQSKKIVAAEVVTAVPLGDGPRAALTQALGRAAGGAITLTERVDPSIVGGVIARVGGTVFDGSVTRQIARMKERLLADS